MKCDVKFHLSNHKPEEHFLNTHGGRYFGMQIEGKTPLYIVYFKDCLMLLKISAPPPNIAVSDIMSWKVLFFIT